MIHIIQTTRGLREAVDIGGESSEAFVISQGLTTKLSFTDTIPAEYYTQLLRAYLGKGTSDDSSNLIRVASMATNDLDVAYNQAQGIEVPWVGLPTSLNVPAELFKKSKNGSYGARSVDVGDLFVRDRDIYVVGAFGFMKLADTILTDLIVDMARASHTKENND